MERVAAVSVSSVEDMLAAMFSTESVASALGEGEGLRLVEASCEQGGGFDGWIVESSSPVVLGDAVLALVLSVFFEEGCGQREKWEVFSEDGRVGESEWGSAIDPVSAAPFEERVVARIKRLRQLLQELVGGV